MLSSQRSAKCAPSAWRADAIARIGRWTIAFALLLAFALASSPSQAAMANFDGAGGFGFDNSEMNMAPNYVLSSDEVEWKFAGSSRNSGLFDITFDQAGAFAPMGSEAFEVEVCWTVRNPTPGAFNSVLVFFSSLGPGELYDGDNVGIDLDFNSEDLRVIHYKSGGFDFYFAGFRVDFGPDEVGPKLRSYRLEVHSELIDRSIPQLSTGAFFLAPEPTPALLVGLGLVGLAMVRRVERKREA